MSSRIRNSEKFSGISKLTDFRCPSCGQELYKLTHLKLTKETRDAYFFCQNGKCRLEKVYVSFFYPLVRSELDDMPEIKE